MKYFFNKLRKMRLAISKIKGYHSVDELIMVQARGIDVSVVNQKQGREYEI
ncbi:MAG: hypothetical protein IJ545_06270 [Alphaproteobacteria bacterium]|nr:hypothetical protein [Alphaproteobacteria bacterium]